MGLKTPILLLTAKGQIADRVTGLDAGADDYLTKPFSTDELLARVRALLRRSENNGAQESVVEIKLGSVHINFARQEASRESNPMHLAPKEFAMLRLMAAARGKAVSRERFLDSVWGYSAFPTTRMVDNHIAKLRAKLEPDPDNPKLILTVQGVGYRLELPPQKD